MLELLTISFFNGKIILREVSNAYQFLHCHVPGHGPLVWLPAAWAFVEPLPTVTANQVAFQALQDDVLGYLQATRAFQVHFIK